MFDNEIIINIIIIISVLLLFLYILKYYYNYHFIIIEGFNENNNVIEKNNNEFIKKRYSLRNNTFLMLNQLINKDFQRFYRYVYPSPINDDYYIKNAYNNDNYNEIYTKYDIHPLDYINDDLSNGLSKEADKIVLNSKNNN